MRIVKYLFYLALVCTLLSSTEANASITNHFFTDKTFNESFYYMPPTEVCDNGIDDDGDSFVDCDDLDCVEICSGNTSYCETGAANNYFEWIDEIQLNVFDFQSGQGFGYDDFSAMEIDIASESVVNLTLKPGYVGDTYEEFWSIWIDLNKDGDFEDENELMYRNAMDGEIIDSFYVPTVTEEITTKMRVSMQWESYSDCCGELEFGEVEDYTVVILPANYYPEVCVPTNNISGDWVERVSCENINNQSGQNQGYADFTNMQTELQRNEMYSIDLEPGCGLGNATKYWKVWIDLNRDGNFQGKFECVVDAKSNTLVTKDFVVPPVGEIGPTKMRVVMSSAPDADPCSDGFIGEVEDYTVDILPLANFVKHIESELESSKPIEIPQPIVTIYPNPSSNFINVDASLSEVNLQTIVVFSVGGRMIEHRQVNNNAVTNIGLEDYEHGNYYMMVVDENNQPTYHNFTVLK